MTPKVNVQILYGINYFNHRTHLWTPVGHYFKSDDEAQEYAKNIRDPHHIYITVTPAIF